MYQRRGGEGGEGGEGGALQSQGRSDERQEVRGGDGLVTLTPHVVMWRVTGSVASTPYVTQCCVVATTQHLSH
jgi:hypothetical protein